MSNYRESIRSDFGPSYGILTYRRTGIWTCLKGHMPGVGKVHKHYLGKRYRRGFAYFKELVTLLNEWENQVRCQDGCNHISHENRCSVSLYDANGYYSLCDCKSVRRRARVEQQAPGVTFRQAVSAWDYGIRDY